MQPRNLLSLVPLATLAMALVANAADDRRHIDDGTATGSSHQSRRFLQVNDAADEIRVNY